MFSKVLVLAALVAAVAAQHDHHGHHEHHGHHAYSSQSIKRHDGHPEKVVIKTHDKHGHVQEHVDYYAYPKYEFAYKVEDKHTGDIKSQHEARDGDHVQGYYELHDPHGIRHVDYHSDKKTGFQASVKHSTHHVVPEHHHHH